MKIKEKGYMSIFCIHCNLENPLLEDLLWTESKKQEHI